MKYRTTYLKTMVQTIILFAFSLYFFIIVFSGAAYRFVHERHIPLLLISALLFLIIGMLQLYQCRRLMKQSAKYRLQSTTSPQNVERSRSPHKSNNKHITSCLFLGIFIAALTLISITAAQEVRFSQFSYTDPVFDRHNTASTAVIPAATNPSLQNGMIIMDGISFSPWLTELYTNLDKWVGIKISVSGFVWKDAELFNPNEFALARMMMVCCAADMQPVGILAQWPGTDGLLENEWIELTGTIEKRPYKNDFDPMIIVDSVKKIDKPLREYIYP